jgi:quinol monooxygenase YgiN
MIMTVPTIELVPGHTGALEDLRQLIQVGQGTQAGLRRVTLLRDSAHPTHYLIVSEWAGHDELAAAMRAGAIWLHRGWTSEWLAGAPRVYDEIVDIGEPTTGDGRSR